MSKNMRVVVVTVVIAAWAVGAPARLSLAQTPKLLPGTKPNVFATVQGNAVSPVDGLMRNATVRLRDARTGKVVQLTTTDKAGLFTFQSVDPGSYIVELMGNSESTLAASQILNVNAGEMVSAIVKVPFRTPPAKGLLGQSAPSAVAVVAAAAASGVLATAVTGQPASSRQ